MNLMGMLSRVSSLNHVRMPLLLSVLWQDESIRHVLRHSAMALVPPTLLDTRTICQLSTHETLLSSARATKQAVIIRTCMVFSVIKPYCLLPLVSFQHLSARHMNV